MKSFEIICLGEALKRIVSVPLIACLLVGPGMMQTMGGGDCSLPSSVNGQNSSCGCSGGVGFASNCGSGIDVRSYEVCYGGYDQGYETCLNLKQVVGTEWDCSMTTTWAKILACSAQAALCSGACASSAAHAGVFCAACIANYVASCTGCGFVTCVKKNERDVEQQKKAFATGTCPKSVNTGQ